MPPLQPRIRRIEPARDAATPGAGPTARGLVIDGGAGACARFVGVARPVRVAYLILAASLVLAHVPARAQDQPVRSVERVDLARYLGKWYEIAAFPMFFQRQCVGDTTAEYSFRDDGDIRVVNRCRTADGFDEAVGRAWAVEGIGNGQLKVSFFWPFRSDYWIVGLDEDYRWAVVGNPERKYLWILSRTPALPKDQLDRALGAARSQGYDLGPLRYTPQTTGAASK